MTFYSVLFLFYFLPIVVAGNWLLRKLPAAQAMFLTLASLLFYSWCSIRNLFFILIFGAVNYALGLLLHALRENPRQKAALTLGICADVLCLFAYKYLNFAISIGNRLLRLDIAQVDHLLAPLGISFLCFTMIAYLVDICKQRTDALRSPVDFMLYLSFFPKISQGPITTGIMPGSGMDRQRIDLDFFCSGLSRFIIGLGKKVLIADVIGQSVDLVFEYLNIGVSPATAWMALLCYTLQIFFDFSGYTDMAIGLAGMLGYRLPENFDRPYLSRSVGEFWRRWHITLGMWFRNYVYIPLGGNRKGQIRTVVNLAVVWALTGLWHGAAWKFILWGTYFGILIILERFLTPLPAYQRIPGKCKRAATFLLVMLGWIPFRSESLSQAYTFARTLAGIGPNARSVLYYFGYFFDRMSLAACAAGLVLVFAAPAIHLPERKGTAAAAVKYILLAALLVLSIVFTFNSTYHSFIYFQF